MEFASKRGGGEWGVVDLRVSASRARRSAGDEASGNRVRGGSGRRGSSSSKHRKHVYECGWTDPLASPPQLQQSAIKNSREDGGEELGKTKNGKRLEFGVRWMGKILQSQHQTRGA